MPSLKRAWLLPRWRPLRRWVRTKMVRVFFLYSFLHFTSFVMCAMYFLPPDDIDLELRLARFEQLIARRPLLLNSVLLRQNPHNVHEWHKRVKLYEGNPRQVSIRHFFNCNSNKQIPYTAPVLTILSVDHQYLYWGSTDSGSNEIDRETSFTLGVLC